MAGGRVAGEGAGRQRESGNGSNGHDRRSPWRTTAAPCVLIVDDEPGVCFSLRALVQAHRPRWDVEAAPSIAAALAILERRAIHAAIVDVRLGTGGDGLDLIDVIRTRWPAVRCYVLTGFSDASAMRRAASVGVDVYEKPTGVERLLARMLS